MQHSNLGASGAKRWLACPGSIRLTADLPPSPTNKYAAEGTVAHAVCEAALLAKCRAEKFIGKYGNGEVDVGLYDDPNYHEFEFEVTREMAEAVQVYLDAINEKMDELRFAGHNPILYVENQVSLAHIQEGMFGTNDASIWVPGVYLGVFDYKHGKGVPVEVEDNPQTNYYGVGSLHEICWEETDQVYRDLPEEVEMVIVQPRANHANGPVRRWSTSAEYLLGPFTDALRVGAAETLQEDARLEAGDHCRWCQAEAFCPAIKAAAAEAMRVDFENLDIELDDLKPKQRKAVGREKAEALISDIGHDPQELANIIKMVPIIEHWAATIKEHAQTLLENGNEIPGFKLVYGTTRRRYIDKDRAIEALLMVLPEHMVIKPREPRAFTELEKLPGVAAIIDTLTEKPEPALTMVPESDKRPTQVKSAAKDAKIDIEDML